MIILLKYKNRLIIFQCQLIEDIDENTKIFYGKGKAPMPIVDPRDFVVINRIYKIENGYFLLSINLSMLSKVSGTRKMSSS